MAQDEQHITVTFFSGGAGKSYAAGGAGGTGKTTVEPFPSQAAATLASLSTYVNSLQENLASNGFMDPEEKPVPRGIEFRLPMTERTRLKRFDQLLKSGEDRAGRDVAAVAGIPANWEEILRRGPRKGMWPRTDWDWVACMEWDIWKQVSVHNRDYEKEVAKSHLSWSEKVIVRIARVLTWMEKFREH